MVDVLNALMKVVQTTENSQLPRLILINSVSFSCSQHHEDGFIHMSCSDYKYTVYRLTAL